MPLPDSPTRFANTVRQHSSPPRRQANKKLIVKPIFQCNLPGMASDRNTSLKLLSCSSLLIRLQTWSPDVSVGCTEGLRQLFQTTITMSQSFALIYPKYLKEDFKHVNRMLAHTLTSRRHRIGFPCSRAA